MCPAFPRWQLSRGGVTYNIHKRDKYEAYDMPATRESGNINLLQIFNDMIS